MSAVLAPIEAEPARGAPTRSPATATRQVPDEDRTAQVARTVDAATRTPVRPPGASRAVITRRRWVMVEIVGVSLWCVIGFNLFIDAARSMEITISSGILERLGEENVSTVLGDAFLIFGPEGPPIVANLTASCSSLGNMLALSALAFACMRQRPQAAVGLLCAAVWAVVANQIRLVLSLLAGVRLGVRSLVLFHDWVGAIINFCFVLIGLLVMVAFTMQQPERAEQDRSGRHTARRPYAWARPGLGYRVDLDELPPTPRIRVAALVHRWLLPRPVSRWLGARRERRRIDYRLGHLDPADRAAAVIELTGHGLGAHTATLIAVATFENDGRVLNALAEAIAARQWEPVSDHRISALRLWARAWLMRRPVSHERRALARVYEGRLIAVTGAGGPAGVAVIRSLQASGHRVLGIDADTDAVGLRLADEAAVLPRADEEDFPDALLDAVAQHRPAALICTVAEEYGPLGEQVEALAELGCGTWLPPLDAAETCLDKKAFAVALKKAGVPHPATAVTRVAAGRIPGPWIVKPNRGRGSRDVMTATTSKELSQAFATVPDPVVQTRLDGREFTADVLVDRRGNVLTCVPRWRDETRGGISVRGSTFDSHAVTRVVIAAVTAVGLTGPSNVQGFVADPEALDEDPEADVRVTIVEINPRFSGGLPLTLASGADVVGTYLAGILDPAAPLPRLTYAPEVRMARRFAEVYYDADGTAVIDPLEASCP
jgi:exosortase/archaeosortase family protein